jgi:TRAP-type C4-dicarboxylate transport system permease small subunit
MHSQEGESKGLIDSISYHADRIARLLLAVMMAIMTVDVLFGVFNRFLFKMPVSWVEEIATYLLIWVSLLGSAVATRIGGHVGVGLIVSRLRGGAKGFVSWVNVLTILFFIVILIFLGMKLAIREMHQLGHATRISMFWPFLSIPIGCLMILIQLIYLINLLIKKGEAPLGS